MHVLHRPHLPRLIGVSIAAAILAIVITLALAALNDISQPRDNAARRSPQRSRTMSAAHDHATVGERPVRQPAQPAAAATVADRAPTRGRCRPVASERAGDGRPIDHYRLLGVRGTRRTPEIRRAYRRLARRHHPDLNPTLTARTVPRARRRLHDPHRPSRRARYDHTLHRPAPPSHRRSPRAAPANCPRGMLELSPREARLAAITRSRSPTATAPQSCCPQASATATRHPALDGRPVVLTSTCSEKLDSERLRSITEGGTQHPFSQGRFAWH